MCQQCFTPHVAGRPSHSLPTPFLSSNGKAPAVVPLVCIAFLRRHKINVAITANLLLAGTQNKFGKVSELVGHLMLMLHPLFGIKCVEARTSLLCGQCPSVNFCDGPYLMFFDEIAFINLLTVMLGSIILVHHFIVGSFD